MPKAKKFFGINVPHELNAFQRKLDRKRNQFSWSTNEHR